MNIENTWSCEFSLKTWAFSFFIQTEKLHKSALICNILMLSHSKIFNCLKLQLAKHWSMSHSMWVSLLVFKTLCLPVKFKTLGISAEFWYASNISQNIYFNFHMNKFTILIYSRRGGTSRVVDGSGLVSSEWNARVRHQGSHVGHTDVLGSDSCQTTATVSWLGQAAGHAGRCQDRVQPSTRSVCRQRSLVSPNWCCGLKFLFKSNLPHTE